MLILLQPEQALRNWSVISEPLRIGLLSHYEKTDGIMANIAELILSEAMQCWSLEHENKTVAIGLTMMAREDLTRRKSLIIEALVRTSDEPIADSLWMEALSALAKYGRGQGCTEITLYTDVERLKELVLLAGGSIATVYGRIPI